MCNIICCNTLIILQQSCNGGWGAGGRPLRLWLTGPGPLQLKLLEPPLNTKIYTAACVRIRFVVKECAVAGLIVLLATYVYGLIGI